MAFENLTQGLMKPAFGIDKVAEQLPGLFGESAIRYRQKEGMRLLSEAAMNPEASKEAVFGVMSGVTQNMGVDPEKALEIALRGEALRNTREQMQNTREDRAKEKTEESETLELLKKYDPTLKNLKTVKAAQAKLGLDDRAFEQKVKNLQYQEALNEAQQKALDRKVESLIAGDEPSETDQKEVLAKNPKLRGLIRARDAAKKAGNDQAVAKLTVAIEDFRQKIMDDMVEAQARLQEAQAKGGGDTLEEGLAKIERGVSNDKWQAFKAQMEADGLKTNEPQARRLFPYWQLISRHRGEKWSKIPDSAKLYALEQIEGKDAAEIDRVLDKLINYSTVTE